MEKTRFITIAELIVRGGLVLHVARAQQLGIKRTDRAPRLWPAAYTTHLCGKPSLSTAHARLYCRGNRARFTSGGGDLWPRQ